MRQVALTSDAENPVVQHVEVMRSDDGTRFVRVVLSTKNLVPDVDMIEFVGSLDELREWIGEFGLELGRAEHDFLVDIEVRASGVSS